MLSSTVGSVLEGRFWWCLRDHAILGIELGSAPCKASAFPWAKVWR